MTATSTAILLALLLPFQDGGGRSLAQKDAAAARAITQEFGLSRWSDKLLERSLAKAKSSDDRAELLLARCDILRLKALRTVDDKQRLVILGDAGKAYADFLDTSSNARNLEAARKNLGELTSLYARTLANLLDADQLEGEERTAAIATAEELFKSGLTVLNGLIQDSDADTPGYTQAVFNRAMIYRYWSTYYPSGSLERKQYGQRAADYLEDFALSANVYPSMLAYTALADVYGVLERYEDATDFFDYVIDSCEELLDSPDVQGDPEFQVALEGAIQGAFAGKLAMLRSAGMASEFMNSYQQFLQVVDDRRMELTTDGYQAQLEYANQLVDDGDAEGALALSTEVADANPQSFLRLKANAVMGRAIRIAPADAHIPLSTLFDTAEGAFYQKRYEDAIRNFRLIMPRLKDAEDAEDFGGRAYYLLGRSWSQLGMDLFAAIAHEAGAQNFPEDEEHLQKNAEQWEKLTSRFLSAAPEDHALEAWHTEAIAVLGQIGGTDAIFDEAKRLGKLALSAARSARGAAPGSPEAVAAVRALNKAIDAYGQVDENSDNHERAIIQQAVLSYELIPFEPAAADRALAMFQDYLDNYITDEANTPSDPRSRKVRHDSEPLAAFNLGRCWRAKAKAGDASAWEKVLSAFADMRKRYPDQDALADDAMRYRIEAFINLGRMEEAAQEYQAMLEVPASDSRISVGAYYLYSAWSKAVDAAEDVEARIAAKEKALTYLHAYNSYATNPRWQNLLGEANLQMELDHPEEASGLYQRILADFGSAKDMSDASRFSARIGYVESLLALRRVGEAVPVVEELVKEKPKNLRVKIAVVKVKAGFLAWDGRQVLEVPGEGTQEALELASQMAGDLIQLAKYEADQDGINPFYYAPWWEAKLMQAYVLYQRGKTNPADQGKHKRLVESLQKQDPTLGEAVAGKRVSQSFKWLLLH